MAGIEDFLKPFGDAAKSALVSKDGKTPNVMGATMSFGLAAIGMVLGNFLGGGLGIVLGGLLLGGLGITAAAMMTGGGNIDPAHLPSTGSITRGASVMLENSIGTSLELAAGKAPTTSAPSTNHAQNRKDLENTIESNIATIKSRSKTSETSEILDWYAQTKENVIGMKANAAKGVVNFDNDLIDIQAANNIKRLDNLKITELFNKLDEHIDAQIVQYTKKVKNTNTMWGDIADTQTYTNMALAIPTYGTSLISGASPRYNLNSALDMLDKKKIDDFQGYAKAAVNSVNSTTIGGVHLTHGETVVEAIEDLAKLSEYVAKKQKLSELRTTFNIGGVNALETLHAISEQEKVDKQQPSEPKSSAEPSRDAASLQAALDNSKNSPNSTVSNAALPNINSTATAQSPSL
jgi:hypothetical protein